MLGGEQLFNLRTIARPPLFIPESLYAKKVLELFKKNKNKFGVVVDEYGNTEGIITLHDLTEVSSVIFWKRTKRKKRK